MILKTQVYFIEQTTCKLYAILHEEESQQKNCKEFKGWLIVVIVSKIIAICFKGGRAAGPTTGSMFIRACFFQNLRGLTGFLRVC
jgi:hypothetical protein